MTKEQMDRENSEWDHKAAVNWARLSEEERKYWRGLVKERMAIFLSAYPKFHEGLARGWAYDPRFVVNLSPSRPPGYWKNAGHASASGGDKSVGSVAEQPCVEDPLEIGV